MMVENIRPLDFEISYSSVLLRAACIVRHFIAAKITSTFSDVSSVHLYRLLD